MGGKPDGYNKERKGESHKGKQTATWADRDMQPLHFLWVSDSSRQHKYIAWPVSLMSYNPQSDYQSFSKRCPEIGDEVKPAQMYS